MSQDWKYIMFEVDASLGRQLIPVIFPGELVHSDVRDRMESLLYQLGGPVTTVSAGFIPVMQVLSTEGMSETLHLKAKSDDADVINCYSYNRGRMGGIANPAMIALRFIELLLVKLRRS